MKETSKIYGLLIYYLEIEHRDVSLQQSALNKYPSTVIVETRLTRSKVGGSSDSDGVAAGGAVVVEEEENDEDHSDQGEN